MEQHHLKHQQKTSSGILQSQINSHAQPKKICDRKNSKFGTTHNAGSSKKNNS